MAWYVKIDRSNGSVVKRKEFSGDRERAFHKPFVWLEEIQETKPVFDPETHKLVQTITQSDLSDMDIDVDPLEQRVKGYDIVLLSVEELQVRLDRKISLSDGAMFGIIERLLVVIATSNVRIKRSDLPESDWDILNARLALRGEGPV